MKQLLATSHHSEHCLQHSGDAKFGVSHQTRQCLVGKSNYLEHPIVRPKPTSGCHNPGMLNSRSGVKGDRVWLNETTFWNIPLSGEHQKQLATTGGCYIWRLVPKALNFLELPI